MAVSFQTGAEPIAGYTLMDRLGSGGFGEVWKCEAPGGIYKAMKVIHGDLRYKDTDAYRFAEQELKAMKRVKMVRHPYLLALDRYDIVDGRLCIVMELADCNLWDRFRECRAQGHSGIPREELMQYMFESAEVLDLMNDKHQLQHLDIKPQNLFLLYNHVKVADFGQVKDLELHVAQVTGGITPVYAAPETFDGFVSRFCDQYSLACVYQELLTGVRPFDGSSMTQLMMQHLQQVPNLTPSPSHDRPALLKALSKKPEDRFNSISDFTRAIRDGVPARVSVAVPAGFGSAESSAGSAAWDAPQPSSPSLGRTGYADPSELNLSTAPPGMQNTTGFGHHSHLELSVQDAEAVPLDRPAIREVVGDGCLRPALVLGLGYSGMRTVQRFRKLLEERYSSCEKVPAIRTLVIDTDNDGLLAANETTDRELAVVPDDLLLPMNLNRAAYYLRPRSNGRALIEGWLDSSVLYRMPRVPETAGMRCLGRLAFCDHYRTVMAKIMAELELATAPESQQQTQEKTLLERRTNLPTVYVVAGLGGGTGSGMIFDLAYALRAKLKRFGYPDPDIVAVLLTPPTDGPVCAQAKANTFAALTELNHYSHADTSFYSTYEDAHGAIRDRQSPFTRTLILPGFNYIGDAPPTPPSASGRRTRPSKNDSSTAVSTSTTKSNQAVLRNGFDPTEPVAQIIRLELFSPLGRVTQLSRNEVPAHEHTTFGTAGLRRFTWPRGAVIERAAKVIGPVLLGHWIEPDSTQIQNVVPRWTLEQWTSFGLEREQIIESLKRAIDNTLGYSVEQCVQEITEPLATKGWLAKLPEPNLVSHSLNRLTSLFGPPHESDDHTVLQVALHNASKSIRNHTASELMAMIPALLDTAAFRLAGTEEVIRQFLVALERNSHAFASEMAVHEKAAKIGYDRLANYSFQQRGVKKLNQAEFNEAIADYPQKWFACLICREVQSIYTHLHDLLLNRLNELSACRIRVQERHQQLIAEAETAPLREQPDDLLPVGCASLDEAAQRYLSVLNDDDLNRLETRFQEQLTKQMGGVFETCLNSADGPSSLVRILREVTQEYLDERMGDVDLFGMMKQKFGSTNAVGQVLVRALSEAEPKLVGRGPWSQIEVCGFLAPAGSGGTPIAQLATTFLPPNSSVSETSNEVVFYREYSAVPLSALDQFGPAWSSAYKSSADILQASPHTRADITQWIQVD